MGRYQQEAASFKSKTAPLISSLNSLTGKLNSIASDLQKNEGDAISTNVLSRLDGIKSQRDAIINKLGGIAAQVMDEAIRLDEEEERRRLEEEKKQKNNTSGIRYQNKTNINMIS